MTTATQRDASPSLFDQPKHEAPMSTELQTVEVTPMTLLHDAVHGGMSPEQLAQLVELQERIDRRTSEKLYDEAMAACQKEMPDIATDSVNPDTHSRFAKFETIQQVAKPIYNRHGFSLSFGDGETIQEGWKQIVCDCRHRAGHCVRYHIDLPIDGIGPKGNPIGGMNRVQGCTSTNSYGSRVLTCNIFNITIAGKDKDGRSSEKIGEAHIATLKEWIETTCTNQVNFLRWLGVETLAEITTDQFAKAMTELKRKAAKK